MAEHIADRTDGLVYMRFHNEAWSEWPLGMPTSDGGVTERMRSNLGNYLLSYLTYRRASRGRRRDGAPMLTFAWATVRCRGVACSRARCSKMVRRTPARRAEIITMFQSITERRQNTLSRVGIDAPIDSWPEVRAYTSPAEALNVTDDLWAEAMLDWTAAGYFDFITWHPHAKPLHEVMERELYEEMLSTRAAPALSWMGAELAFELLGPAQWPLGLTGAALDQFVMEDYVRKWTAMVVRGDVFCSPVIGGPHPKYIGLYRPDGSDAIAAYPAREAFANLASLIGSPESTSIEREDLYAHYRFDRASDGRVVDVVYRRSVLDADANVEDVTIDGPSGYANARVEDSLGVMLSESSTTTLTLSGLGQAPRVVVWTP